MNHPIRLKTIPPFLITLTLLCSGLLPRAQTVVPPPDGGYPGFTTAEGNSALQNLTTGVGNTAAGWHSLFCEHYRQLKHGRRRWDAPFLTRETTIRPLVHWRF